MAHPKPVIPSNDKKLSEIDFGQIVGDRVFMLVMPSSLGEG
jgi:hypothetical protein